MQSEAKEELRNLKAIRVLLQDNEWACEVSICGMSFGMCDNKQLLPAIESQISEIEKYLNGSPNLWE